MNGQKPQPFRRDWLVKLLRARGFVYVQPKLDGVHLLWERGRLWLPSGEEATGLPRQRQEMAALLGKVPAEAEAYIHGAAPQTVAGIARRTANNLARRNLRVSLHVFDLCTGDTQERRLDRLFRRNSKVPPNTQELVRPMPTFDCHSETGVAYQLGPALARDFEGIVIRDPEGKWKPGYSAALRKIKPGGRDEYEITGCNDHHEDPGSLHSITVQGQAGQMTLRHLPFNRGQCIELWQKRDQLIGRKAVVRYTPPPKPGFVSVNEPPMVSALVSIEGVKPEEAA